MKKLASSGGRPFWFGLLTVSLTSVGLLSGTAFAQKYQETNLVANTSQSGVTTVDPDLVNSWGLLQSSTNFGTFSHSIIVGQFGSGEILAFNSVTGEFQGKLEDQNANALSIPGLWDLAFGAGNANSGAPNQLLFNAGSDQGKAGLFGFFAPVAADLTQGNDQ